MVNDVMIRQFRRAFTAAGILISVSWYSSNAQHVHPSGIKICIV